MKSSAVFLTATLLSVVSAAYAQTPAASDFKLALTGHKGQLQWKAEGFQIVQSSAKPGGRELGVRGDNKTRHLGFLGFLFLAPEGAPQSSSKCRDQVLAYDKKQIPSLSITRTAELPQNDRLPVAIADYTTKSRNGALEYNVRGFIAVDDICGDLEIYSSDPIKDQNANISSIFSTYRFDQSYQPAFADVFLYGQVLYKTGHFEAAAPVFEKALTMIPQDGSPFPSAKIATHVTIDQAGMAYGISGNFPKARSIFEAAIAKDPDYPMYYYNLACADAEEKKLKDAQHELQEAFARRANVNPGESLPDPSKDDSFTLYHSNKDFWSFITSLKSDSKN